MINNEGCVIFPCLRQKDILFINSFLETLSIFAGYGNKKNRQKIDGFQIFISLYNYFLSSSKNSS